jgi:hypothetical protein
MKKIVCCLALALMPLLGHADINPAVVKDNIIGNSRAALGAAKLEYERLGNVPLIGEYIMGIPTFLAGFLSGIVDDEVTPDGLLDSPFFAELFNADQIVASDETRLAYNISPTLCGHVTSPEGKLVCSAIMLEYNFKLEVTSTNDADYDLTLSLKLVNGGGAFEQVVSSSSHRNATAKTVDLEKIFKVFSHMVETNPDLGANWRRTLTKLEGQISFGFHFTTPTMNAACAHQARTCVYLNIDKDVSFSIMDDNASLHKWAASPILTPSVSAYVIDDHHIAFDVNNGPFCFETKVMGINFSLGRLVTNFIIHPRCDEGAHETDPVIVINSFSLERGVNKVGFGSVGLEMDFRLKDPENALPTIIDRDAEGLALAIDGFSLLLRATTKLEQLRLFDDVSIGSSSPSSKYHYNLNHVSSVLSGESTSAHFLGAIGHFMAFANNQGMIAIEKGDVSLSYSNGVQSADDEQVQLRRRAIDLVEGQSITF